MNIFETISDVTNRYEPFHSQFLTDALKSSIDGDDSLFRAVWQLSAKPGWESPDDAEVSAEEVIEQGRVDIVIASDNPVKRVVGIEVKTVDASVHEGQLKGYLEGLRQKFPAHDVQIAYLTPFNRKRAGDVADSLRSVREFEEFLGCLTHARHVSWLDIAEISWDGNALWKKHQDFVRNHISAERKLWGIHSADRQFETFFGEESSSHFWEALRRIGIVPNENGARIDMTSLSCDLPSFSNSLIRALGILLDGENVSANARRPSAFDEVLRPRFLESKYGKVHETLFRLADRCDFVWIEGSYDYAVRVAHRNHRSGVSLLRSSGPEVLLTGQRR